MLPYKEGMQVVIDPNFLPDKLHFGKVPIKVQKLIGKIDGFKYIHNLKTNTYRVDFGPEYGRYWFLEKEIG